MSNTSLSRHELFERIHHFVVAGVCDELSETDWQEFEQLLCENEEARRLYFEYLEEADLLQTLLAVPNPNQLQGICFDVNAAESKTNIWQSTFGPFTSGWPLAYAIGTLVCCVGLLLASLTQISHQPQGIANAPSADTFQKPDRSSEEGKTVVARVTGASDCRFSDGATFASIGTKVLLGQNFDLESGLLEIRYHSGAQVLLQGPVAFEVDSPFSGHLSIGRLTARVERKNTGAKLEKSAGFRVQGPNNIPLSPAPLFAIHTATATVADLGTEFGVDVDRAGLVKACVFEGLICVSPLDSHGVLGKGRILQQGQAVSVSLDRHLADVPKMPRDQFIHHLSNKGTTGDDFSTPRNYLTAGTAGTIWSGILNAAKASRLDTLPKDGQLGLGSLTIGVPDGAFVGWEKPQREGLSKGTPFLYIHVPEGDFEAQVDIKSQSVLPFSVAGLMARRDDDNFISINKNCFNPGEDQFDLRSEKGGVDMTIREKACESGKFAMRLVRLGDAFLSYSSRDGGITWKPLDTGPNDTAVLHRPDMTGPLQVGLWYGTFNPAGGEAVFDNFTIRKLR